MCILTTHRHLSDLAGGASGKEPACQSRRHKRCGFNPWIGRLSWRSVWQPLQHSCLENPMNRGAWQDRVHGSQGAGHG